MKKKVLRDLAETLRDEMHEQKIILDLLKEGPKTVPEIANQIGSPSSEVMMWVMAMIRYGKIKEIPKGRGDDYFQYQILEGDIC